MTSHARGVDRRSRRRWVLLAVAAVVLAWAAVAAQRVLAAADELEMARAGLAGVETALRERDLDGAELALTGAVERAERSSDALGSAVVRPLTVVPVVGANLRTTTAISDAARDSSRAAVDVLDALDGVIGDGASPGDVEVALEELGDLGPSLRRLSDTLRVTTEQVRDASGSALVGQVADARQTYLDLVAPQLERVQVAAELAEQLPALLGADGPRTYLVGAASLSELRGSGGLMGSFSLMTADAGRLTFEEFVGIEDLERTVEDRDVPAPSTEFATRYRALGGLRLWRNANLSPDFPPVAEVLLELWESDGERPPLDGVILADSVTFAELIAGAGEVEVPGVTTLTADNVGRFVGLEAYAAFDDQDERKRVLGAVATAAFGRMAELLDGGDLTGSLEVLSEVARGGHLLVYARDRGVQEALVRAGVAGQLDDLPGERAGVVVNNVAGNKVDYFTRRDVEHHVTLVEGGRTEATVRATFVNEAPTVGYPRYVLGPWTDVTEAGDNLSEVTLLCGLGCEVTEAPDGAGSRGEERGLTASDLRLLVPAGEERTIDFATSTPSAWRTTGDGEVEVVVEHRRQPTSTEDRLRVVVDLPAGHVLVEGPDGARVEGDQVVWEAPTRSLSNTLRYRFRAAGDAA